MTAEEALAKLASLEEDVEAAALWHHGRLTRLRNFHSALRDAAGLAWEAHKLRDPGCRVCGYERYLESGGEPSREPPL